MKTVGIPEDIHKELINLKLESGDRNVAEIIRKLIYEYKKRKFLEFSDSFKKSLSKNKKSFDKLLENSRKIREEISDEWF